MTQVLRSKRAMILAFISCVAFGCWYQDARASGPYQTENVVIAVMDGTHYERTFGDPTHALIPHLWNDLRPQGTYYTKFYNNAVTITQAGHQQIMTGAWSYSRNRGPLQTRPTIIDYMADELGLRPHQASVIFGKGFYAYNPLTSSPSYRGSYQPDFVYGIGETTYQQDYDVLHRVYASMKKDRPRLIFVNFGTTDHTAHSGDWPVHIGAVKNADEVLFQLWQQIQRDPHYRNKTTLILTNDHGYQDDGIHDGFAEHGDASEGSRHVMLLMLGPDTRKDHVVEVPAYHIDIAPTVGELLGFQTPLAQGEVLTDSFVAYRGTNKKETRTERARHAVAAEQLAASDVIGHLADRALQAHPNPRELPPSIDGVFLLWGLLSAYDKMADHRYLDYVASWSEAWSGAVGPAARYVGFIDGELSYRLKGYEERQTHLARAVKWAKEAIEDYSGRADSIVYGDRDFLLALIQAAAVSERSRDEALWHRVERLYIDHVQRLDDQFSFKNVTTVTHQEHASTQARKEGETVEETGKVLPDIEHKPAGSAEGWYLLTASFIRSHGLPFKGENLPDLPFFGAELLYRSSLLLDQLAFPGDLWPSLLDSAVAVAAIREARRRVTLRGELFESVDGLTDFDLAQLRPESAEIMPPASFVKELVHERLSRLNYNVQYGFPRYQGFDFMLDLLRRRVGEVRDDLTSGLFLLALDPKPRISTEPFVASPRP